MNVYGLFFVVSYILTAAGSTGPYKDDVLLEVPNNQIYKNFKNNEAIDVWEEDHESAIIHLTRAQYNAFDISFSRSGSDVRVLSNNVQEIADSVFQKDGHKEGEDWFTNYHTYEDIQKWYINHSKNHPTNVKFVPSIGKTIRNKEIFAVHLTNNNTLPYGKQKNKIWFQSLIHAREWLGGSTTQYIFNEFLKNRDSDSTINNILNENEIIFIPVSNPDGYIYSRVYRFWRKNKNLTGVDINRNFPYHWGGPGASTDPTQDDYRGPGPASELETQAIIKYFTEQGHISGAIDFHTFSELVLRPPGDTTDDSPDETKLKKLGDGIRDVIKQSRGTEYTSQKASELYPASGTAMDWFYGEGKTYGYTIELSPKKSNNILDFAPPPSFIKPVGAELFPAAVYFIKYVTSNPLGG